MNLLPFWPLVFFAVSFGVFLWLARHRPTTFRTVRPYAEITGGAAFVGLGMQTNQPLTIGLGLWFLFSAAVTVRSRQP